MLASNSSWKAFLCRVVLPSPQQGKCRSGRKSMPWECAQYTKGWRAKGTASNSSYTQPCWCSFRGPASPGLSGADTLLRHFVCLSSCWAEDLVDHWCMLLYSSTCRFQIRAGLQSFFTGSVCSPSSQEPSALYIQITNFQNILTDIYSIKLLKGSGNFHRIMSIIAETWQG